MDLLAEELLILIIKDFPCRTLYFLKNVNIKFKAVINNNNLMEKRKIKCYPRGDGHAEEFDVEKGANLDRLDIELDKLYAKNIDLVRGDLITFWLEGNDQKLCIFDGCKIINLTSDRKYLILPEEFNTITNNVPLDYWKNDEFYLGFRGYGCLDVVWLNISQIKEELLVNVTGHATKFTHNNIEYKLHFESYENLDVLIKHNDILKFTSYQKNNLYQ